MAIQQIPDNEWMLFFRNFSQEHSGKIATLELLGGSTDQQVMADHLPFVGISADLKDRERDITITLGDRPDASITHVISAPSLVVLDLDFDRTNPTLEIEAPNEPTTRLLLHGG